MISATAAGNLSYDKIVAAKDYALAAAAKPFMGDFGYTLISVAALLSTASAINATLYGAARVSFIIAKEGELPEILEKKIWNRPVEGLLITSAATLLTANFFDPVQHFHHGKRGVPVHIPGGSTRPISVCTKKQAATGLFPPLAPWPVCAPPQLLFGAPRPIPPNGCGFWPAWSFCPSAWNPPTDFIGLK